jgi:predicted MFS family arabinose efflux permease
VLPQVAGEFGVSIAPAASFAAVFAITFAIVQPVLGAAADLFSKARLMVGCLMLACFANILGAMLTSFSLLGRASKGGNNGAYARQQERLGSFH